MHTVLLAHMHTTSLCLDTKPRELRQAPKTTLLSLDSKYSLMKDKRIVYWYIAIGTFQGIQRLQFVHNLLQVNLADFACDDLNHPFADVFALWTFSIGCLLDLIGLSLCKANAEHSQKEAISCLYINYSLNHSLDTRNVGYSKQEFQKGWNTPQLLKTESCCCNDLSVQNVLSCTKTR